MQYAIRPEPRGMSRENLEAGRSAVTVLDVYEAHAEFEIQDTGH